jgi:N-acyl-D-amino-acid deacylase
MPNSWRAGRLPHTAAVVAALLISSCALGAADHYDTIVRNGHIVDGTGSPWYKGDVGIRQGRIAALGFIPADATAERVIDAGEQVVAPGFIDMLGQSEMTMLVNPSVPSKIFQGITSEITGEGGSIAPLTDDLIRRDHSDYAHYGIKPDWHTLGQYFERLEREGMGINLGSYVGATQVRRVVIGDDDRAPTDAELEQMRELVRKAMRDGAMGLSTALQYPPAPYAKTGELIALAKEAAKYGGIYASHIRNEGNGELQAIDEAVQIGREAGLPVEIWHLKAAGKSNWGRMPELVARIEAARAAGVDIAADTYAYTAWFNSFSAFLPPWVLDGGTGKAVQRLKDPALRDKIRKQMLSTAADWDNEWEEIPGPEAILFAVAENPKLVPLQGRTIAEIAKTRHRDAIDTIFDLLIEDPASSVAVFGMSEPDVALALKQPWVSIDNDSSGTSPEGVLGREHPHPRAYGTFPRILHKYVRDEHLLTLEDAIRKFSSLPAQRMHLADRGVLKAGMWADIVVFNPDNITEHATFEDPNRYSSGMRYVMVNGVLVIDEGKMTRALPGRALRGPGAGIRN